MGRLHSDDLPFYQLILIDWQSEHGPGVRLTETISERVSIAANWRISQLNPPFICILAETFQQKNKI